MFSIVNGNRAQHEFVSHALCDLAKLESRPPRLTEITYEWCSAIYANRDKFEDWENLLLYCLELGFRHLNTRGSTAHIKLTHGEHHRELVDVVFKSQKSEVIADFLRALTAGYSLPEQAGEVVGICIGHLVDCHKLVPFLPRLRLLVIRFIGLTGYKGFEGVRVEKLIGMLDHLHVTIEEMDDTDIDEWSSLLLAVIRSSEAPQRLSDWYWERSVELAALGWTPEFGDTQVLKIAESLIDAEEWGKLECWIGIAWMYSGFGRTSQEELEPPTLLLLRRRPGAVQKLEQWIEKRDRCRARGRCFPEALQRILTRAHEAVQRQRAP